MPIQPIVNRTVSKAIDDARAPLILGVIFLHTALIFRGGGPLEPVILFGTTIGMPLFFLIAGYSIWHSLGARGAAGIVQERVRRVLLPLIAAVVCLLPIQAFVEQRAAGGDTTIVQSIGQFLEVDLTFQLPIPLDGPWFELGHLWFLAYLFAFTMILLPGLIWLHRRDLAPRLSTRGALAIAAMAVAAIAAAEGLLGAEHAGGSNRWTFLVFLAFGVLVAMHPRLSELAARRWRLILVSAFAAFCALAVGALLLQGRYIDPISTSDALAPTLWRAGKGLTSVLFVTAAVGSFACRRSLALSPVRGPETRMSAALTYVKRNDLPLYIVHQTILVGLAYWIIAWHVSAPLQWLTLLTLTLTLSLLTIELARRTRLGSLMLGIKPAQPAADARQAPQRPSAAGAGQALAPTSSI